MSSKIILVGYSGHAFVVADCIARSEYEIIGYCDTVEKIENPFNFTYLGKETEEKLFSFFENHLLFLSIGDNRIREKIYLKLTERIKARFCNVIDLSATISSLTKIGEAVFIAPNVSINALASIGNGVICNTGAIIEHECKIDDFAHIAPGATLAGNVTIGKRTFIGANAVVKQGIIIGDDVTVGAGSVIIKNISDGKTVVGNPQRLLYKS